MVKLAMAGVPDILAIRPPSPQDPQPAHGHVYWFEVKLPGKHSTPIQKMRQDELRAAGCNKSHKFINIMSNKRPEGVLLSRPFITTCSHCGHEITIPYEGLPHHFHQQLGRLSAAKRADRKKHLSAMNRQRWHTYAYPKQEALLAVAKTVDIDTLPMTQIADRLGYVGRYRGGYVKRLIRHLQKKGLLPEKR